MLRAKVDRNRLGEEPKQLDIQHKHNDKTRLEIVEWYKNIYKLSVEGDTTYLLPNMFIGIFNYYTKPWVEDGIGLGSYKL